MASYGIARPLADSLFLDHFAALDRLWGMALTPVAVTLLLWPYGRFLSRFGPRATLLASTLLSGILLAVPLFFPGAVGVFLLYVWKEAYVVLLVEQLWALANSTWSVEGGKKRYGPLLLVGGMGALAGNKTVSLLAQPLGTRMVYAGAVLLLLPFAVAMLGAFASGGSRARPRDAAKQRGHAGLGVLARSPYLVSIAVIVGLGQVLVATLDPVFQQFVGELYPTRDVRSAFLGEFWFWVNAGSMALQVLAPAILQVLSVAALHLVIPLTHLATIGALVLRPGLTTAAVAFAWFKMVDYSLFRAAKEVLYVPLDFDSRYRAKMVIDMAIYRTTKGVAGLALSLARQGLAALTLVLPGMAAGAAGVWVLFAWKVGRDFAKLREGGENQ